MRRNRDLQIKLLRKLRDGIEDPEIQETPEAQIIHNAALLIDEGLVNGKKAVGNIGQCVGVSFISLTPAGHDFLEEIDHAAELSTSNQPLTHTMKIFISHSSQDAELAGKLARLFQLSFALPANEIRCTSVDEYRLSVGTDTDQQLRMEVKQSKLFLAVITPTSIRSSYVLFELGGRWCTELPMFPVLARGATIKCLEGPLGGINALDLQQRKHIIKLLEDMAKELGVSMESLSSVDDEVNFVWEAAKAVAVTPQNSPAYEASANAPLDADDIRILLYIDDAHPKHPDKQEITEQLGIRLRDVEYSIRKLANLRFVSEPSLTKELWHEGQPNPDGYFVLDKGIEYIRQQTSFD